MRLSVRDRETGTCGQRSRCATNPGTLQGRPRTTRPSDFQNLPCVGCRRCCTLCPGRRSRAAVPRLFPRTTEVHFALTVTAILRIPKPPHKISQSGNMDKRQPLCYPDFPWDAISGEHTGERHTLLFELTLKMSWRSGWGT